MEIDRLKKLFKLFLILIFLYLFLVSIGLMGVAFKGFGKDFVKNLLSSTSNPFVGLFIGILATGIVQSSSTITSIVVGMVASGVITLGNAIPIVMGANIGTTVTNTLVSLGHVSRRDEFRRAVTGATVHDFFNIICVAILFPIELYTGFLQKTALSMSRLFADVGGIKFTSPIKIATKPAIYFIEHIFIHFSNIPLKIRYGLILIVSFLILFLSLYFIVNLMRQLIVKRAEIVLNNVMGKNGFLAIIAGFLFTAFVQSSSITTSLLVPIVASGILTVETIFPITMGANIGTTTTAILASFATGNILGITIAFVHFLFNVIGVLFLYPLRLFRAIPIKLAKALGEIVYRKRRYAVIYVMTVFFGIPLLLIIVSRLFE